MNPDPNSPFRRATHELLQREGFDIRTVVRDSVSASKTGVEFDVLKFGLDGRPIRDGDSLALTTIRLPAEAARWLLERERQLRTGE